MKPSPVRWTATALAAWLELAGLVAAAQAPPASDVERALRAHPYYSKLALERVDAPAPYLFLFQRVPNAAPERAAGLVEKLLPFLEGTRTVFEQRIAAPNALARRAGHDVFPVIVLGTRNELVSCQGATRAAQHLGAMAVHDPALNACVLYDEGAVDQRIWLERVRAARHVLLHACQQAWYAGAGEAPLQYWLFEGMADALSSTAADPAAVRTDPAALRRIVADMLDPRRSFLNLRTLAELFTVGEQAQLDAYLRAQFPEDEPAKTFDRWSFSRQASLLFAYLWSDERSRPALVAFAGDALRGQDGAQEFAARFAPATEAELEQGFLAWLLREHRRALPLEKVDEQRALQAFARTAEAAREARKPTLELSDASAEERLALAIFRFAAGADEEAAKLLEALSKEQLEAELTERVARECRRLEAWRTLRNAHLAGLAQQGGSLAFEVAGRSFQAKVLALEGAEVVLEKNRSGKERLALAEIDALALAQEMRPLGTAQDWARLVPYALREDPRTKKLLREDGGEASALLADARDDYPARLRLGRMLARIEALAEAESPDTRAGAEKLLAELRALRAEGGDFAVVQRKEPALLAAARTWLEAEIELLEPTELFGGKLELLEKERVRITYEFQDARELADFEACLRPVEAMLALPALEVGDQPFYLQSGDLVALGRAGLRSRFDLAAPLAVRYGLCYVKGEIEQPTLFLYLGIADDRAGHYLAAINFRTLLLMDKKPEQVSGKEFPFHLGAVYELELAHDGQKAFLRCEGREVSVAADGRKAGALFLGAHSVLSMRITRLVIEGALTKTTLASMRRARLERELATF